MREVQHFWKSAVNKRSVGHESDVHVERELAKSGGQLSEYDKISLTVRVMSCPNRAEQPNQIGLLAWIPDMSVAKKKRSGHGSNGRLRQATSPFCQRYQ